MCWCEGYDNVYGMCMVCDGEVWIKCVMVVMFYWVMGCLLWILILVDIGDFCLLLLCVLNVLCGMCECYCFMKGFFSWVGFKWIVVFYYCYVCVVGISKFSLWWLWNFVFEGIIGFLIVLLWVVIYFGLVIVVVVFVFGLWVIVKVVLYGDWVVGWLMMMVVILFLGGV